ncbi:uncharacterized protein LOC103704848 [Phoenix dactylifera]|uniref:Uncharacterized protein LOC103704848 n=1 Tax=Phoenix dactylifera TaxID=42345 RepID=A0A8B7BVZ4_PHODC|nr:uncharacterized protein LOC103704848 [Phoenix dactylifera]
MTVMSSSGEVGDGPAVLQLQKWSQLHFQLQLSEFCEAFISPTRELLLLLSYQCEALLLPLVTGKGPCMLMKTDDEGKFSSEGSQEPSLSPFVSSGHMAVHTSDTVDKAPCPTKPSEIASSSIAFSHGHCSSAFEYYPVISNVKSLAWGHCGDGYNVFEDSGFRELLIVCGDDGITVHAFRYVDKSSQMVESVPDVGDVQGKWVQWGPTHRAQSKEHSGSCENLHERNMDIGTGGRLNAYGESGDVESSNIRRRNWLKSFQTVLDTNVSSGKYLARFPAKSSLPHSAKVVSFSIYNSTLLFLKFRANSLSDKEENRSFEIAEDFGGHAPISTGGFECMTGCMDTFYKCSRVFSSSSHHLVGLVMSFSDNALIDNHEHDPGSTRNTLVVVIMLHPWGLQWVCMVDLQGSYAGVDPRSEWVDFQFADNFLVCLNASGLICIWDANSGNPVVRFDVLQSCGLDTGLPVSGDTSLRKEKIDGEVDQQCEVHRNETCTRDLTCGRTFRRLMVASHSLLLAILDEHGLIYVICADDYISEKHYLCNNSMQPSQHSDLGILAGWKVAGYEISGQNLSCDPSRHQGLLNSNISGEGFSNLNLSNFSRHRERRKKYSQNKESQMKASLSGFSTAIQKKVQRNSQCGSEVSSTPMRRIFLPINRSNKEDSICLSPFGVTRLVKCNQEQNGYKIVHTSLYVAPSVLDERDLDAFRQSNKSLATRMFVPATKEYFFVGEPIGCSFQGCLYLVSQDGLSVVLPSVSISSGDLPTESIRYWQPSIAADSNNQVKNFLAMNEARELWRPWQIEVLDRVLLYEGPEEAEHICLENGWDLKIVRVRQMQLALQYLKSDEIEQSLDMLGDVNMAEEGILRLLFTSVYQIFCKTGSDNEVALASRLLALAARFATKMIRRYGLLKHKKEKSMLSTEKDLKISSLQPDLPADDFDEISYSRRLFEMSHFLEVIRNLQSRLISKSRRPSQGLSDAKDAANVVDADVLQEDSPLPVVISDTSSSALLDASEGHMKGGSAFSTSELAFDDTGNLALAPIESSVEMTKLIPLENPKDMVARWAVDNFDLKTVVKDALHSGRLPLAVLQLHLQHQRQVAPGKEPHDTFSEIRDVGRAIAYDLFLKGESELAVATLQRLGEDIEVVLRELLFGTVRRSLRARIADEMKSYGYLRAHEWKTLERISLIERLYPSSNFWGTFLGKQKNICEAATTVTKSEAENLILSFHVFDDLTIECGDIDGVVIGCWENIDHGYAFSPVCEDSVDAGYWACAAAWSDAWDQRTVDRIVLDQPFYMGVHVPWESQLEYHVSHNNLEEVYKLLDVIPTTFLSEGCLKINLDSSHSAANDGTDVKSPDYAMCICAAEELEPVCIDVPHVKILRFPATTCSSWLKMLVEQELAKRYIFLKEYWQSTAEIISLLARAGFLINSSKFSTRCKSSKSSLDLDILVSDQSHNDTIEALHKLVVHHCIRYNLPYLLDLYLDHHNLALDYGSLCSLQQAAGDCQWAKWLLFSRIKGCEYEASFANARSNLSRQMILGSNLSVLEIDEIIRTVDDMAEGGGEMAALATLMYAAAPMQECACSGSVNRHCSSSSQCTLENLRPGLQHFPTLWRTLVASCFGQEANDYSLSSTASNVFGKSAFSDYLNWRNSIFSSAGGDASLIQMLPCWFPKSIRRLIKLFVQGPLGWQSLLGAVTTGESFLYRDNNYVVNANRNGGASAISWEASIQKSIEKELCSSLEENRFGVEHHLHRGRALAAFNHLLGARALNLKSANARQELSGQPNIQADVQAILAPLTQSEGSILSSVVPLAIMHFEDSVLVASCAFFLELCGLSASILRVDIAALRRISAYYNSAEHNVHYEHVSPRGSVLHAVSHEGDLTASLARALADDYIHHDHLNILEKKDGPSEVSKDKPSQPLMSVLHHLEKASLPPIDESETSGTWLLSGIGDGSEFRSRQKDASRCWNLVTAFCQMHHLPLSTKYLALLANDNDWVGFLTEAQMGGFPVDVIIQVAAKEFSDPRLKTHILTVLRSMQSRKKTSSLTNTSSSGSSEISFDTDSSTTLELFGILAECEKQKNPGEALLRKAKDLRWSLLAMIASCFPDVSPLACLTVWLEITAARETSSIKVDDISSKIANSVGAAVEVTNTLPIGSRMLAFRYNRRNSKRRRLMVPTSGNSTMGSSFNVPSTSTSTIASIAQEIVSEEESKRMVMEQPKSSNDLDEGLASLSNMVAVLCEQHLFLPLLRAFEMFLPSCSLLPFIRFLQAFSQMRLPEASAHLASFSARIKEEPFLGQINSARDGLLKTAWISSTAVKAADAMLSTCPSAYEKRCLLQLLAAADFADGGSASTYFRRLYWKINLAEPSLHKDDDVYLGNETLDDASLLTALEKNGHWEQARNWARQLESSGASWKSAVHHVTEAQAEAMVVEWKEFLWDIPDERAALWSHCQTLFLRYSFPPLQAGLFFLKHAETIEKEIPARELHEMLLLSLQWLSGTMTQCPLVYPLHLLREIETRVWLLAVESEAQFKADLASPGSVQNLAGGNSASIIEQTASIITKMDNHIHVMRMKAADRNGTRENNQPHHRYSQISESNSSATAANSTRMRRRAKTYLPLRRPVIDNIDNDSDDYPNSPRSSKSNGDLFRNFLLQEDSMKIEASVSAWEEKVRPAEMERAVLSLLEFGQITAAKQLQQKLSPEHVPLEFVLIDAALKLAVLSSSNDSGELSESVLDPDVLSVIQLVNVPISNHMIDPFQALELLATKCGQGCGGGLCRRITAVVKAAKVLGLPFSEAFEKRPIELLQLLSLKAQDSLEEAKLLVQTHSMPPPSIARILAESFLKGLLAAHRGGYMDSQKEEGPAPLLWRFSDFLKWAELCPSEPEIGHALMRLVMTGQEIPHACEVELLILSHHFYKSSACLDGVDVLVTLAANRVESYVLEGDFSCLARLITGVSNFHALNFILNILIENGQLELLLQKYSTADIATGTAAAVRGFRMAVLTSLKLFNPQDLDAFAMVYNHFDMKHETASLLESRSVQCMQQWLSRRDKDRQNEDLLEAMRHLIDAAEVLSTIDAGHKTHRACARASLLSLQIRIPDLQWIDLSETNARRALVDQSRFQEALIVAEAYNLNHPGEWAPVLWNLMLKPDLIEQFVVEFVAVLPLQPSMLLELARYYRAEVAARGDQSHFSVWLSPGGLPAEWVKHLGRSFRILLKRTRDLRLRMQLATIATGFGDVIDACMKVLDKVPDNAGPLILRRGHGGAYLPLV